MIVGVPREIKTAENRVALVPAGVESLVGDGHSVLVEQGAGIGSGFADEAYRAAGAKYLEKVSGGSGILLGGVPGVLPAEVLIIGGGVVGANAAKMAAGLGARVTLLDLSLDRLRYLADVLPSNVDLLYSNRHNLVEQLQRADLVIGAVLLPGAKAPKLVRRDDLKLMKPGSVIVDVAVDQGGCIETS